MKKLAIICLVIMLVGLLLPGCGGQLTPEELAARDYEYAQSCIDKPVAELYKLVGEPENTAYSVSCMGDGMDGQLFYEGFIVYTYKAELSETVRYVAPREG